MHDPMTLVGQFPPFAWTRHLSWKSRRFVPTLVEVWHHDPSDYDSETCGNAYKSLSHWRHWSLRLPPIRRARTLLFDRCAWCGGWFFRPRTFGHITSRPDQKRNGPWWRSTTGLYHSRPCATLANEDGMRHYRSAYESGQREPDPAIIAAIAAARPTFHRHEEQA